MVAQAKEEIAILKKYLPEALSDDELKAIVAEVIAAVGATSPKDMGKVMPAVMAKPKAVQMANVLTLWFVNCSNNN